MMYGGSKMNKNQLDRLIEQYIDRFEELNSEPNSEGYKWETFQKFTDSWNIDSTDFIGMFEDAFKDLKSNNLLQSGQFQPVIGILDLLKHQEEIEYVRALLKFCFLNLVLGSYCNVLLLIFSTNV